MINWHMSDNMRLELGYGYGLCTALTSLATRNFSKPGYNYNCKANARNPAPMKARHSTSHWGQKEKISEQMQRTWKNSAVSASEQMHTFTVMQFFRYSIYKILTTYAGLTLLGMLFYGLALHSASFAQTLKPALLLAFIFGTVVVLIGANNFYIRQRLLFGTPENSVLDVFDDGKYTVNIKRSAHLFLFIRQELTGVISGYPVHVTLDPTRGGNFEIRFSVHKTQGIYAGHQRTETLIIPWDARRRLKADIQEEVTRFVSHLHLQHDKVPPLQEEA